MSSKKESLCCGRRHSNQGCCSKIGPCASEGATPELDRGCFDLPACPNQQLCTLGTGRALEPHSHLAAIVCPGGPGRPVFLPPPTHSLSLRSAQLSFSSLSLSHSLSLSRSRSLPLSPSLLSVFVPQGPVVQLKLSVTQRNQIGFHLQPVTSCVHCASVLPLSAEKKYRFYS